MMIPYLNRCVSLGFSLLMAASLASSLSYANGSHEHCSEMIGHEKGGYSLPISTGKPEVQKVFDQGMNWAFAFHHNAAAERFAEAVRLDPNCAMCYWGMAYVKGPNINAPMAPEAVPLAYDALMQAMEKMDRASPKEQALIQALAQRYTNNPEDDRTELDQAYAKAMKALSQRYPDDPDLVVLAVEAIMDTMPWNYWTADGEPREGTEEMIAMLKRVLEKNPVHPGAIHFLIHIVEKERPELAEEAADRLVDLVPAAGHLQHMASHIYIRVGRYHDASRVNELAIKADQEMISLCPEAAGIYQLLYVPHNYEFLVAVASLEGREALARQTAQSLRKYIEPFAMQSPESVDLQQFWLTPILSAVKFQDWESLLSEPAPPSAWKYASGFWHFGRAMAWIKMGKSEDAAFEIKKMEELAQSAELQSALLAGLNPAAKVLMIGVAEAKGELAFAKKSYAKAVQHLKQAIQVEDGLTYIEPPAYYHSVRLTLGKVYQTMGLYAEAEQVFRQDLQDFPKNGWALYGLYKSVAAQERLEEAASLYDQYLVAWLYADTKLGPAQKDRGLGGVHLFGGMADLDDFAAGATQSAESDP